MYGMSDGHNVILSDDAAVKVYGSVLEETRVL